MKNLIGEEIAKILQSTNFEGNEKENICLSLHFFVFELQRAIYDLVILNHIGAALALQRPIFEAHVKANWLQCRASEKQVFQFKGGSIKSITKPKNDMTIHEMIAQLESLSSTLKGSLLEFKDAHLKAFHSFTHVGVLQFARFFPNHPASQISNADRKLTLIDFSNRMAVASLRNVSQIMNNEVAYKSYLSLSKTLLSECNESLI